MSILNVPKDRSVQSVQIEEITNPYALWFGRVVWVGILANLLFVIPLCFFPEFLLSLLKMELSVPSIWVRVAGVLLLEISILYIPGAINPYRYKATAWMSIFVTRGGGAAFFFAAVFFFDQNPRFLTIAVVDVLFGVIEGVLLYLAFLGDLLPILVTKVGQALSAIALSLVVLTGGVGYAGWYTLFREVPTEFETPAEHFKYGSIGTENAEGIPFWVWEAMPRLFPEYLPKPGGYTALGLTWEEGYETPVGITKKTIGFPRQGITCAVCHSATYRTSPTENPTIVPTGPSTKFDLQGYVRFLGNAGSDPRFNADYILPSILANHNLSLLDRLLYRFVIIPRTKRALADLETSFAWMDSRPNWGPGRIDPFNPVKFRMLGLPDDGTIGNSDMMPIWNEDNHNGFAYHWDGLETSLTETVQTGALGDGATLKSIDLEGLERVEQFIREFQPPAYPFPIDAALAEQGKGLFDNTCASCHAFGGERTGTVIPVKEVGTDRHRLDMWTQAAVDAYSAFSDDYSYDFQKLQKTNGYVAVALDGLWLRAPYLHNGSVPYLPDLLEAPENRTSRFYRGYDVYDPQKVGFVAEGDEAEKQGTLYDTNIAANSNQGHLYGVDLSAEQKGALVEYLKTL